jgi:hypothetical protein
LQIGINSGVQTSHASANPAIIASNSQSHSITSSARAKIDDGR